MQTPRHAVAAVLGAGLFFGVTLDAQAQIVSRVGGFSPATAISAQIQADASLLRAYGEASYNLAAAREVRARAIQQEIVNSVEYVKAYWERKSIYEAEKMKRYVAPLDAKNLRDNKTWERLRDHPELNGPAAIDGTALNFLLDRMAGGILAYTFSPGSGQDQDMLKALQLPPTILHGLRLRQDLPGGQRLVFRADEGTPLSVDWWPFVLRDDEFTSRRDAFAKARQNAAKEAQSGKISNRALKDLMQSLDELDAEFRKRYDQHARQKSFTVFQHFLTADRFIKSLAGEISRLQTTGDASVLSGSLRFEGDNLITLLTFMSRNGLKFAPAQPGEEAIYQSVFRMMRDVYITVADIK